VLRMDLELSPLQAAAIAGVVAFGVGFVSARLSSRNLEKKENKDTLSQSKTEVDEKKSNERTKSEDKGKKKSSKKSRDRENKSKGSAELSSNEKDAKSDLEVDLDSSDESSDSVIDESRDEDNSEPCKLVLGVRMDLKMEKGKIAAQCCHATLGAYEHAVKHHPEHVRMWKRNGQAKITVKINSDKEMTELFEKAKAAGITAHIVVDAGRTQIAAGSKTILAIGPAPNRVIDTVTGNLKLY